MTAEEITDIEMRLLMDGVYHVYGYDFREYAESSLRRRLNSWLVSSPFANLSEAQARILREPAMFVSLLKGITVNVSEMFRDPAFFRTLREQVIPHLKTYPFIKIWHAGCATGEEVYSMAILLHEEGLQGRYRIYATDINKDVLKKAQDGIYPLQEMQRFTKNYQQAGGNSSFSDYYTARYDHAILHPELREEVMFSDHNLATDAGFGEMNMILCRNVMIYFQQSLKDRVVTLFDSCLAPGGFLCLGTKETLERRPQSSHYELIAPRMQIFRKLYGK